MNKKIFFLLFFLNYLIVSFSQQQFIYQFYIDNSVREGVLFYDEVGNKAIYLDKITQTKSVNENNQDKQNGIIASFGGVYDSYFYKNNNIVNFTQDLLKTSFLVEDQLPQIDWELTSEKKEIQNLVCYKAVAKFRGRNWIAWYCPEIPITYGPWKFYGLPGLIVEIKDDSNRFVFNLSSYVLKTHNLPPAIDVSNFKKVSMKQMADNANEAFDSMMHIMSSPVNGQEVIVTTNSETAGIEPKYEWEE